MSEPLVSVVILNYRRRQALSRALNSVRTQAYVPREVIVVDNGSEDETPDFLATEYPEARVVALNENLGCGGRNRGVEAAQASIVVTIDNDVSFDSPFELGKTVLMFERHPEASCLVFRVLEGDSGKVHLRDWCHPRNYWDSADAEFETCFIPEGACAFRRDHFLDMKGYYEPLWIGHEGWDLALRMLDAGRRILYQPEIRVRHDMAAETRTSGRNFYFYSRNSIWIAFKDYPAWRRPRYLAYQLAMMGWFSARCGHGTKFLQGVKDGFLGLRNLPRTWVSKSGWQRLREITAHRPGWRLRLKKHRKVPLV